jgi:hypothetical protein
MIALRKSWGEINGVKPVFSKRKPCNLVGIWYVWRKYGPEPVYV